MDIRAGVIFSHYKLVEKIGQGGMGVVWKARDTQLPRYAAIKFLPADSAQDDFLRQAFLDEAKLASSVNDARIAQIYELGHQDDVDFIVMEFVAGQPLRNLLLSGALPPDRVCHYGREVAIALSRAHRERLIHRDLKPGNVLVTPDDDVKVVDFGLATLLRKDESILETAATRSLANLTEAGKAMIAGTIPYMSPEQLRGEEVDSRTDIFSLGCVLYEMSTGQRPFLGVTGAEVMQEILKGNPRAPHEINDQVPMKLERITLEALAHKPVDRYQSMDELAEDLKQLDRELATGSAHSFAQLAVELRRKQRRRQFARASFATALFLIALVVGFGIWRWRRPPPDLPVNIVAVFPFTLRGSEENGWLQEGIADILAPMLDGAGDLRSVDSGALLQAVASHGGTADDAACRSIAREFGAGSYVRGTIVDVGGELRINGSFYETQGRAGRPRAQAMVQGTAEELLQLTQDLTAELLGRILPESQGQLLDVAARSTQSFPALRAFLEAESHMRAEEYKEAVDSYERAVQIDTLFALPYYRLIRATGRDPSIPEGEYRSRLIQLRDRLPDRERRVFDAGTAYFDGYADSAITELRSLVNRYPDFLDARVQLAEHLLGYGRRTNSEHLDEAKRVCEVILARDPDQQDALMTMQWLSGVRERFEESAAWGRRRISNALEGYYTGAVRAQLAFWSGDDAARRQIIQELRLANTGDVHFATYTTAAWAGSLMGAVEIAELLMDSSRPPRDEVYGKYWLRHLAVARGRWRESNASGLDEKWITRTTMAGLAAMPFLQVSEQELRDLRDVVPATVGFRTKHSGAYIRGVLSIRLGELEAAEASAAGLDTLPGQHAVDLARTLRAEIMWLRGDLEGALGEIEGTHPEQSHVLVNPDWITDSETLTRALRAQLLEEAGRYEEARRWYQSLGMQMPGEVVYLAVKHLHLGDVNAKLGETAKALDHYERFISLWSDCDLEQKPLVERAQQAVSALRSAS